MTTPTGPVSLDKVKNRTKGPVFVTPGRDYGVAGALTCPHKGSLVTTYAEKESEVG